ARPSITSAIAAAASSLVRSSCRINFSISDGNMVLMVRLTAFAKATAVRRSLSGGGSRTLPKLPIQKIPQDAASLPRQDRFRMELHAVHGPDAMTHAHDHMVLARPRADFEIGRQPILRHHERVVPRGD